MLTEAPNHSDCEALLESGFCFLNTEEYDRAYDSFKRASQTNDKSHKAYWGMLLSERQCKYEDGSDLVKVGICIDSDPNYRLACQHADTTTKANYEKMALLCAYRCHIILIGLICEKRMRPAQLRAKHYASSKLADKQLIKAHTVLLRDKAYTEFTEETPCTLIALLERYRRDPIFSVYDRELRFSEQVKGLYREYMDRLLRKVALEKEFLDPEKKKQRELSECLRSGAIAPHKRTVSLPNLAYDGAFYADPEYYQECRRKYAEYVQNNNRKHSDLKRAASALSPVEKPQRLLTEQDRYAALWVRPCDFESEFVGADGKPCTAGERWRYLAKHLPTTEGAETTDDYGAMILDFFDLAIENGADRKTCLHEKQVYFDQIVSEMDSTLGIQWLSLRISDKRRAYFRLLELVLNEQMQAFSWLQKGSAEACQEAERLIEVHRRIPKKDAEWLQRKIKRSVDQLDARAKSFQERMDDNAKETGTYLVALSEPTVFERQEYQKLSEKVKRNRAMLAVELEKINALIIQLRKYESILSERNRNPFVRYIELKSKGES